MNELDNISKELIDELYRNGKSYSDKTSFLKTYFDSMDGARVLDVGFYGQGFKMGELRWPHNLIAKRVAKCVGIDIAPEVDQLTESGALCYRMSAETFHLDEEFDVIFSGDNIEHLSNPGLFFEKCLEHLAPSGKIVITTPNPYFLASMLQKLTIRNEPSIHPEHTCMFSLPSLLHLSSRYGLTGESVGFIRLLKTNAHPGFLFRVAVRISGLISVLFKKFSETYVVILVRRK